MKNKDKLAVILIALVLLLSCLPLFKDIHNINLNWDWLQHLGFARASRQAILEYGQLPLRTPYFNGGYPLFGHPLENTLNAVFLPILIFGETAGLKINIFLFHLLGGLGMYYLSRRCLNFTYLGALFSVFVFALGGNLHRLLISGIAYYPQATYFFIPLLIALLIRSRDSKKHLIYLVAALAILRFSVSIFLFIFLFSVLEAIRSAKRKAAFDLCYIKNFFIAISLAFLLGAAKNFALLELLRQNPRPVDSYLPFWGPLSLSAPLMPNLFHAFFVHYRNFASWGMHWNYLYLGYLPVIFALLSSVVYWKKTKRFFMLLVIFALLSFGANTRLDIFRYLWPLPFFRSIEAPTRHFIPFVIFLIAVLSGQIFSAAEKIKFRFAGPALFLALSFTTADLFVTNGIRQPAFGHPVPQPVLSSPFFQVKNSEPGRQVSPFVPKNIFAVRSWEWTRPSSYELMLRNIGKLNAYTMIYLGEYAAPKYYIEWNGMDSMEPQNYMWRLNPDYRGEVYFLNHPQNTAEFTLFSPNKIVAKVSVAHPDTLVINQNFDKSWRSSLSKPVDHQGLLAVELDKEGEYSVTFTYVPLIFYLGLCVSLASLVFLVYWWMRMNSKL